MTTLTADQASALDAIQKFLGDPTATAFLLEGGAGVGKTVLAGCVLRGFTRGLRCVCAPTHKALEVLRRKLDSFDVPWCRGYDEYSYNGTDAVTGTTASLLGISPIVEENQNDTEVRFGKTGAGILGKVFPELLLVDEASMVSWRDCQDLIKKVKDRHGKLILVGDAGQLPPVRAQAIPFDKFKHTYCLRQVVRQAEDSAIIKVAWAIRDGKPWRDISGKGLEKVSDVAGDFLERLSAPGGTVEENRPIFLGYRNVVVDAVQERACRKVYGHGMNDFASGELVIADMSMYQGKVLVCSNQSELLVQAFHEDDRDPMYGVPVTLKHVRGSGVFRAHYLSAKDLADPAHPYVVELANLRARALKLQAEYKAMRVGDGRRLLLDAQRKAAWSSFFRHKDTVVLSFRHPFASTSHRAQGSTFFSAHVAVSDLARFSTHALYVSVTRPRETLVVST